MLIQIIFFVLLCHAFASTHPKIAVIGGGISGTSAAYQLHELFKGKVDIDLYEKERIGGRMLNVQIDNITYEIGASFFHTNNLYMKKLVTTLGLKKRVLPIEGEIEIWYKSGNRKFKNSQTIYQRYGYEAAKASRVIGEVLEDIMDIYSCQEQGAAFRNLQQLVAAMGRSAKTAASKSFLDLFKKRLVGPAFIYEVGGMMTRVAFGQSTDIHGFAGIIALVGMGSSPWAVEGGATQMCEELVKLSKATLHKEQVNSVAHVDQQKLKISTHQNEREYDAVILAAPLTPELQIPEHSLESVEYQELVTTMVHGERCGKSRYVLVQDTNSNILSIIATHSIHRRPEDKYPVWKVHSKKPLSQQEMTDLFVKWDSKEEKVWKLAYPKYPSSVPSYSIEIAPRMYHANLGEVLMSSAEFALIFARNAAQLVYADLTGTPLKRCY